MNKWISVGEGKKGNMLMIIIQILLWEHSAPKEKTWLTWAIRLILAFCIKKYPNENGFTNFNTAEINKFNLKHKSIFHKEDTKSVRGTHSSVMSTAFELHILCLESPDIRITWCLHTAPGCVCPSFSIPFIYFFLNPLQKKIHCTLNAKAKGFAERPLEIRNTKLLFVHFQLADISRHRCHPE